MLLLAQNRFAAAAAAITTAQPKDVTDHGLDCSFRRGIRRHSRGTNAARPRGRINPDSSRRTADLTRKPDAALESGFRRS
jgi:hypothetical protein